MDLKYVAASLNITTYPDALNSTVPDEKMNRISDPDWIDQLEQSYHIFGQYHTIIRQAAQELQTNKVKLYWGIIVSTYLANCNVSEARQIPMPKTDETFASDFLPLLILMTQLENGVTLYRQRGMPDDVIRRNLDHFIDGIRIVERRTDRPAIDQTYFNWLVKFVKATIFNAHGFNFEIRDLPANICVLQNKETKELIPMYLKGTFHRSGMILNTAGYDDPNESFEVLFTENDNEFIGHGCHHGITDKQPSVFRKDKFCLRLEPGCPVLLVHIPRGTDISAPKAAEALRKGFHDAAHFYPEHQAKALFCQSWLLDPNLTKLLKPESKILQFGNLFTRYPVKSAGKEIFSFVFERQMPLHELRENTSLERALKKHYISGKYIHAYGGVVLPEEL